MAAQAARCFHSAYDISTERTRLLPETLSDLTNGFSTKVAVVFPTKVAVLFPPKWPWITL
jgi:hypothetical protein